MHVWIQMVGGGGGQGVQTSLENHKKYRFFFSNTGPNPLKIVKLPKQLSILGHNRHASETPFKWSFTGGLKRAR